MRICFVCPCFAPAWKYGGLVKVAYELSNNLKERHHKITVFTTDAFDKDTRYDKNFVSDTNIEIYYCKNISNSLAWNQRITISWDSIELFKQQIKKFDVVHIHGFRDFQSSVAYYYCKKNGIPYVIQPHGSVPYINKKWLKTLFDVFIGNKILKNANYVLCLNKSESEFVISKGVDSRQIEILPNGVDFSSYSPLPEKERFKKGNKIPDNVKIILYVGRISASKGLDLLIVAFSQLLKKNKDVRLIFIGEDDGFQKTLQSMIQKFNIEENVIFLGFVSHQKKLEAFIDADLFVTPAFYGFPLTFIEAIVCGVPIITTNKGDIIDGMHDYYGLVTNYDPTSLESAMARLLFDDNLKATFAQNAIIESLRYSWDNITDKLEKIYIKLINESHKKD